MSGSAHSFDDREDAGRRLGALLARVPLADPVVLGLPRGGVPVAAEVARALGAPLEVLLVRKLGVPGSPEVAMGAIGEGGVRVLEERLTSRLRVSAAQLAQVEAREQAVLTARAAMLRPGRAAPDLTGRTAVVVDDGIATGATMTAACEVAHALGAARVIAAVPVADARTLAHIRGADESVCVHAPAALTAVGLHYRDFTQVSDAEVVRILGLPRP